MRVKTNTQEGILHSFVSNNGLVIGIIQRDDGTFFGEQIALIAEVKNVGVTGTDERSVVDGYDGRSIGTTSDFGTTKGISGNTKGTKGR